MIPKANNKFIAATIYGVDSFETLQEDVRKMKLNIVLKDNSGNTLTLQVMKNGKQRLLKCSLDTKGKIISEYYSDL